MAAEGWGEEKFIPRGRSTVKNKERGGGRGVKITYVFSPLPRPLPPPSKTAGRTNDRELFGVNSH